MPTKYTLYLPLCVADEYGNPTAKADVTDIYDMLVNVAGGLTVDEFCRGFWYNANTAKNSDELVQRCECIVKADSPAIHNEFVKIAEYVKFKMNQQSVLLTKQEVSIAWI